MTCVGDSARKLLRHTERRLRDASDLADARAIWRTFTAECGRLIQAAEEDYARKEARCCDLKDRLHDLEEDLRSQQADVQLSERIVSGQLTIDDYLLATKRGWDHRRLDQLAGVGS